MTAGDRSMMALLRLCLHFDSRDCHTNRSKESSKTWRPRRLDPGRPTQMTEHGSARRCAREGTRRSRRTTSSARTAVRSRCCCSTTRSTDSGTGQCTPPGGITTRKHGRAGKFTNTGTPEKPTGQAADWGMMAIADTRRRAQAGRVQPQSCSEASKTTEAAG
jgi:hypothetical protein